MIPVGPVVGNAAAGHLPPAAGSAGHAATATRDAAPPGPVGPPVLELTSGTLLERMLVTLLARPGASPGLVRGVGEATGPVARALGTLSGQRPVQLVTVPTNGDPEGGGSAALLPAAAPGSAVTPGIRGPMAEIWAGAKARLLPAPAAGVPGPVASATSWAQGGALATLVRALDDATPSRAVAIAPSPRTPLASTGTLLLDDGLTALAPERREPILRALIETLEPGGRVVAVTTLPDGEEGEPALAQALRPVVGEGLLVASGSTMVLPLERGRCVGVVFEKSWPEWLLVLPPPLRRPTRRLVTARRRRRQLAKAWRWLRGAMRRAL